MSKNAALLKRVRQAHAGDKDVLRLCRELERAQEAVVFWAGQCKALEEAHRDDVPCDSTTST